jgi:protein-S-isoprenylcysteine O-methyltransferase Ste14
MTTKISLKDRFIFYFSNIFLIWSAILIYNSNKYYLNFLRDDTQTTLLWLAIIYSAFGMLQYLFLPSRYVKESKGYILLRTIYSQAIAYKKYIHSFTNSQHHELPTLEHQEKTLILFSIVKFFFLPLMTNFLYENLSWTIQGYTNWSTARFIIDINTFNSMVFPLTLSALLLIDTLYFTFGYAIEFSWLKNTVRSVEPTVLGWAVALVCYPPFNGLLSQYVNWYPNDYLTLSNPNATLWLRIFILLFFGIYVWATLALGAKSSNLTNRGIVSRGPYGLIRHPAYISKNIAWWLTVVPIMLVATPSIALGIFLSMSTWTIIYYLRAITEERHLIKDPDYVEYCKKVKYRFIPFLY